MYLCVEVQAVKERGIEAFGGSIIVHTDENQATEPETVLSISFKTTSTHSLHTISNVAPLNTIQQYEIHL